MYHSIVLEFRRRVVEVGCSTAGSYVFGHGDESLYLSKRIDPIRVRNGGTVGDITHALKFGAVYSLPFGRGERFGSNVNGVVDRLIGGWQLAGSARVSSGRLLDLGNVRLVGMDQDDLQSVFKLRTNAAGQVFMFPQEIIDESFKAFSVSATSASGYGNLGAPSGRYIAPADSLDCIERIRGEGNCGLTVGRADGPDDQAVRPRHLEAGRDRRARLCRDPPRRLECLQQHQLRPGHRDHQYSGEQRQYQPDERFSPVGVRSDAVGRRHAGAHRPARVPRSLVASTSGRQVANCHLPASLLLALLAKTLLSLASQCRRNPVRS